MSTIKIRNLQSEHIDYRELSNTELSSIYGLGRIHIELKKFELDIKWGKHAE